ncbi:MAG: lipase family protein [Campylobacterota bacterium]|nr:lipase family protein [Campylobacterota bacterium]
MLKNLRNKSISLVLVSSLAMFAGCSDIENTEENIVGNNFVDAEILDDINDSVMLNVLDYANIDATNAFGYKSAFGYKAVKITYNTKGQNDENIVASGLLVIPTISDKYKESLASVGKSFSVSMICDNHPTILTNAEAPSNIEIKDNDMPDHPLAISMTGFAGFAGIYPDYIGYGESNGENHPYMIKKASARASLDMIRASQKYMTDNNIVFNSQLYISGYSQGGYTAMALAEEIETNHNDEFTLMGVAPMAGPYLVDAFGDAIIQSNAMMQAPAYMAFMSDAYAYAYENLTLDEMIVESKLPAFDALFDGSNTLSEIYTQLGMGLNTPTNALIKDSFISDYESTPEHKLREMFKENNVGNWAATTKIKLIHCSNDDVVPTTMTYGVEAKLDSMGATNVEKLLIDNVTADYSAGESIHSNCAIPAYTQAIGWFAGIRGDIK